ncbi:hypothetical protein DFH07DRAFT_420287 [Mycena maculata]|uniref:Secreted protein n=1 Tax=Mycena maculata TaxID=230809 RepID=A0AAD7NGM7_9AGAR|nr:hypothetical protein DFH07DRAFT_420287 [Mycena maculata]
MQRFHCHLSLLRLRIFILPWTCVSVSRKWWALIFPRHPCSPWALPPLAEGRLAGTDVTSQCGISTGTYAFRCQATVKGRVKIYLIKILMSPALAISPQPSCGNSQAFSQCPAHDFRLKGGLYLGDYKWRISPKKIPINCITTGCDPL